MAGAYRRWQDHIKYGPLSELYIWLRWAKRRLRREPIVDPLAFQPTPMSTEELIALASLVPDYGRRLYGLGLSYLWSESATDVRRALACLRSAEALGFEAPERTILYRGVALARLGDRERALHGIASILTEEFTAGEMRLRTQIAAGEIDIVPDTGTTVNSAWRNCERQLTELKNIESLLVLGDREAVTAVCLLEAGYLQCAPDMNGLSLAGLTDPRRFDVACGTRADLADACAAGMEWKRAIEVAAEP
jgi:hypothetical protein